LFLTAKNTGILCGTISAWVINDSIRPMNITGNHCVESIFSSPERIYSMLLLLFADFL